MEQNKNTTQPPRRVVPQAVTIQAALKPQTRRKAKVRTPTPTHHISYEENYYSPPRVEVDSVMPTPQPVHKYPTRRLKRLKQVYNNSGSALVSPHDQKTLEDITGHHYLNILKNQSLMMKKGSHLNTDT